MKPIPDIHVSFFYYYSSVINNLIETITYINENEFHVAVSMTGVLLDKYICVV